MLRKHADTLSHGNVPGQMRAGDIPPPATAPSLERIDPPETSLRAAGKPAFGPAHSAAYRSSPATALNALSDAVLVLDDTLQVVQCNASLADLLGCKPADLCHRPLAACLAEPLTDQQLEELRRLASGEVGTLRLTATARRHDAHPLLVDILLQRLSTDPAGGVLTVLKPAACEYVGSAARVVDDCDFLTGLPARSALEAELSRAERLAASAVSRLAVLFIDLDRFKQVNDSYGHRAGDLVLRDVARRLAASVRPGDFVARYGGDEFVAIVQQLRDETEVAGIAQRIRSELTLPIVLPGGELVVTASVGVAFSDGPFSAVDLLDQADSDMYRVKRAYYRRKPR